MENEKFFEKQVIDLLQSLNDKVRLIAGREVSVGNARDIYYVHTLIQGGTGQQAPALPAVTLDQGCDAAVCDPGCDAVTLGPGCDAVTLGPGCDAAVAGDECEDAHRRAFVNDMQLLVSRPSWKYLERLYDDILRAKEQSEVPFIIHKYIEDRRLKFYNSNGKNSPCYELMKKHGLYHMSLVTWNRAFYLRG